jgi:uncharacterized protein (DUF433 family)
MRTNYQHIVTLEPGKLGGRPCIRGMRITVADILGWLAAGMSHAGIIADFPELTEEDIRAALTYATLASILDPAQITRPPSRARCRLSSTENPR